MGCSYVGMPSQRSFVGNLIGANMSFRKSRLLAVVGFANELGRRGADPAGREETDICIRLAVRDPGTQIVHDPAAIVRHTIDGERLTWRYSKKRCYAEAVSKARVAQSVGTARGLSSDAAMRLAFSLAESSDPSAAIVAGLALTTGWYLGARWGLWPA